MICRFESDATSSLKPRNCRSRLFLYFSTNSIIRSCPNLFLSRCNFKSMVHLSSSFFKNSWLFFWKSFKSLFKSKALSNPEMNFSVSLNLLWMLWVKVALKRLYSSLVISLTSKRFLSIWMSATLVKSVYFSTIRQPCSAFAKKRQKLFSAFPTSIFST